MFAKETYTTRRNSLKKSLGTGLLLFLGNEESGMNYEDKRRRRTLRPISVSVP